MYLYIRTQHNSELREKTEGAARNVFSLRFVQQVPQYVRIQCFGSVVCTALSFFSVKYNIQVN